MRYKILTCIFFVLILFAGGVYAQTGDPHSIYGYVNYNGTPFFQANVIAQNTRTGETIPSDNITDSGGNYIIQLANLPSGFEGGDEILVIATSNEYSGNTTISVNASVGYQKADNITLSAEKPTSNHPSDATYDENAAGKKIGWILTDNYASGYYKVLKNSQTYVSWKTWTNNTNLNVPIDTSSSGEWNYTIYFNDSVGEDGTPDTVIITIQESSSSQSDGALGGSGGGGGGGGGSLSSGIETDSKGKVLSNYTKESQDGKARIVIPEGTIALGSDGKPLESVKITLTTLGGTLASYNIGPDDATFSPPVELEIKYDSSIGKNKDLKIKMFKDGKWNVLETTVDTKTNTAIAKVPHFTVFALVAEDIGKSTAGETEKPVETSTPPPKEPDSTPDKKTPKPWWQIPGFEVTLAIATIFMVTYLIRRK